MCGKFGSRPLLIMPKSLPFMQMMKRMKFFIKCVDNRLINVDNIVDYYRSKTSFAVKPLYLLGLNDYAPYL